MTKFLLPYSILFALLSCTDSKTQEQTGHLLINIGEDTVGIESYSVNGYVVTTEAIRRVNNLRKLKAEIVYREDGTIHTMEECAYDVDGKLIWNDIVVTENDSIYSQDKFNNKKRRNRGFGTPHLYGAQIPFYATYANLILNYERYPDADYQFKGLLSEPLLIEKSGPGEYQLKTEIFRTLKIKTNKKMELVEVSGLGTGLLSFGAKKIPSQDYEFVKENWLSTPNLRIYSTVSPRIKDTTNVQGAMISIDYSAPSKRGRKIFGGLVPYDTIWRTGSNRASHISFDRNLIFGDQTVPAGNYTFFTIPKRGDWIFLLNSETGQWGAYFDHAREVLRIPMQTTRLSDPTEVMEVKIESNDKGGEIRIKWDDTEADIPFKVQEN